MRSSKKTCNKSNDKRSNKLVDWVIMPSKGLLEEHNTDKKDAEQDLIDFLEDIEEQRDAFYDGPFW